MMTSEQFGQLAMQLLAAAQIPGAQLETALAFRDMAARLADGTTQIEEQQMLAEPAAE